MGRHGGNAAFADQDIGPALSFGPDKDAAFE